MDTSLLATVIIPTVLTSMGGIWAVIQHVQKRKDSKEERELTIEQQRENEILSQRKQIAQEVFDLLKNKNQDIENKNKDITVLQQELRIKDTEISRMTGRARFWHMKAWDMRSEAAYARQIVESAARIAGGPLPVWFGSLDLPKFDDDLESQPHKD